MIDSPAVFIPVYSHFTELLKTVASLSFEVLVLTDRIYDGNSVVNVQNSPVNFLTENYGIKVLLSCWLPFFILSCVSNV